jgi:hypothetical protein
MQACMHTYIHMHAHTHTHTAGPDTEAREKILLPLPGIEPWWCGRPAHSQTLYWLSYPTSRVISSKQDEWVKEVRIWHCRVFLFILASDILNSVKSPASLLLWRKVFCGFVSPCKIQCLVWVEPMNLVCRDFTWVIKLMLTECSNWNVICFSKQLVSHVLFSFSLKLMYIQYTK